jgi:hypothetical protein
MTQHNAQEAAKYHFFYNDQNPNNPNLTTWDYVDDWENNETGDPILYKLDQI